MNAGPSPTNATGILYGMKTSEAFSTNKPLTVGHKIFTFKNGNLHHSNGLFSPGRLTNIVIPITLSKIARVANGVIDLLHQRV
jgi:hypothetical protein